MLEVIALVLLSQQPVTPVMEGTASFYTVASSSVVTASGELLRDDRFTCAMRQGEFGAYYLVVTENGDAVIVKLNDRGPFSDDRIIDLSRAAMRKLHASAGLLQVKIYSLGKNPPKWLIQRINYEDN
jgi:rare lipoprotein A